MLMVVIPAANSWRSGHRILARRLVAVGRRAVLVLPECQRPQPGRIRRRRIRELDATAHPPLQHNQLMSECRVLCRKSALRLEREANRVRKKKSSAIIAADV